MPSCHHHKHNDNTLAISACGQYESVKHRICATLQRDSDRVRDPCMGVATDETWGGGGGGNGPVNGQPEWMKELDKMEWKNEEMEGSQHGIVE